MATVKDVVEITAAPVIRQTDVYLMVTSILLLLVVIGHGSLSGHLFAIIAGVVGAAWVSALAACVVDNRLAA